MDGAVRYFENEIIWHIWYHLTINFDFAGIKPRLAGIASKRSIHGFSYFVNYEISPLYINPTLVPRIFGEGRVGNQPWRGKWKMPDSDPDFIENKFRPGQNFSAGPKKTEAPLVTRIVFWSSRFCPRLIEIDSFSTLTSIPFIQYSPYIA